MKIGMFHWSSHRPYKGLLLGALGVSGVAATAFLLSKAAKAQKNQGWTNVEPLNPDTDWQDSMANPVQEAVPEMVSDVRPTRKAENNAWRDDWATITPDSSGRHQRGEE